jgi:protein-disulfide isomerase
VREHVDGARKSGARGTPTFFLSGEIFDVSFGMQRLHDAVGKLARE